MGGYKVTATLTDGVRQWDVVVFRGYKTIEKALDGAKYFAAHGYRIVMMRVEKECAA